MGEGEGPFRYVAQAESGYDKIFRMVKERGYYSDERGVGFYLNNTSAAIKDFVKAVQRRDPSFRSVKAGPPAVFEGKFFRMVEKEVEGDEVRYMIYYKPAYDIALSLIKRAGAAKEGVYEFTSLKKEELAVPIANIINLHAGYASAVLRDLDGSVSSIYVLNLAKFRQRVFETSAGQDSINEAMRLRQMCEDLIKAAKKDGVKLTVQETGRTEGGMTVIVETLKRR